ncbi:GTP-binding protein [Streptomyces fodineus]|uniref:GTP-binding protein n=1 Tax=Streptomyces fodineus TaxID=1904616 RepID=UPI0009A10A52
MSSTIVRSPRPFHTGRLREFVTEEIDGGAYGRILRPKGFFILASRPQAAGLWS